MLHVESGLTLKCYTLLTFDIDGQNKIIISSKKYVIFLKNTWN